VSGNVIPGATVILSILLLTARVPRTA